MEEPSVRHHTSSRLATGALIMLIISGSPGCSGNAAPAAQKQQPIPVVAAQRRTIDPSVVLSGIVAPLQNVAITNTLTEPVAALYVNEGDTVTKGEVLARLSSRELQADLEAARRTAAGARARLDEA